MRDKFMVFVWIGQWTVLPGGAWLTEREARESTMACHTPTRIRSVNAIVQALRLPDARGERSEDRCGWCGSTAGSESTGGDWPRCVDCGGC